MAVVKDYISPEGCRIIVHDDCYKDKSPAEVKKIIDHVSCLVMREEFKRHMEKNRKQNVQGPASAGERT